MDINIATHYQSVLHLIVLPEGTTRVTETFVLGLAPSRELLYVYTVLEAPSTVTVTCSSASHLMTPLHWFVE